MATVEERGDGRSVQLKKVRMRFTNQLHEAQPTVEDGPPKHTCTAVLEADQPTFEANKKKIMSAIKAACEKEFKNSDAWKAIAEDEPKRVCFRKGSRFKNQDGEPYAGFEGNYGISMAGPGAGKKRPKILDRHKRKVEVDDIPDVVYDGTYADIVVSVYGTKKGGKGIFCSVDAIRSHQEGDPFSSGIQVNEDDFDDLEDADDDLTSDGGDDDDDDLL